MKALRRMFKRFEDEMAAAAVAQVGGQACAREILEEARGVVEGSVDAGRFDERESLGLNILVKQAESK